MDKNKKKVKKFSRLKNGLKKVVTVPVRFFRNGAKKEREFRNWVDEKGRKEAEEFMNN